MVIRDGANATTGRGDYAGTCGSVVLIMPSAGRLIFICGPGRAMTMLASWFDFDLSFLYMALYTW